VLRALIWIVAIVLVAVALTLLARYSTGYALLVWPPYRIELSLTFLLLLIAGAFVVLYFVVRAVSATLRLPAQVREYRAARRRRNARATFAGALHEFFSGRYARSEKAARRALEMGEHADLSALIAARSAQGLRAYDRRDDYLSRAAKVAGADEGTRVVTEAELFLEQGRAREALELLERLPRRHTAALRLELAAHQQLGSWDKALAVLSELNRRKAFEPGHATDLRRVALVEHLKSRATGIEPLEEAWNRVAARERTDARIAAAAVRLFMELGGCKQAHRIIEEALESNWDTDLVALYAECDGGDTLRRIERAESWLKSYPRDAVLLLALGRLCSAQELWGKAQSYLEASIAVEPTYSAHFALAGLHEKLGDAEAAQRHYRQSLTLALSQLDAASGGQRRVPI
jgi:HemY protein